MTLRGTRGPERWSPPRWHGARDVRRLRLWPVSVLRESAPQWQWNRYHPDLEPDGAPEGYERGQ